MHSNRPVEPAMRWRIWSMSGIALATGVVAGIAVQDGRESAPNPDWREIAWPFPRDAWPQGRAFRCASAACGTSTELYVRPKIGFCNCTTGVADDGEVDRVTDLDLIGERFAA